MTETELKFKLKHKPSAQLLEAATKKYHIEQYYLDIFNPDVKHMVSKLVLERMNVNDPSYKEIRIRRKNDDYYLTLKSDGHITRKEIEVQITRPIFETLLTMPQIGSIVKERYLIKHEDIFELDVYPHGLTVVEIEFKECQEQAAMIEILTSSLKSLLEKYDPNNLEIENVTSDASYKNRNLAIQLRKTAQN